MTTTTTNLNAEPDVDVASPIPALPELPKTQAVARLISTMVGRQMHEHTARAIAHAVCDPSAVRRQLEQPAEIRVGGGTLDIIHTRVWVPAVLPYPENPRMLPGLTYAVEDRTARRRPLPPARPGEDPASAELIMEPVSTAELIGYLDMQLTYLHKYNDYTVSVGNHGIQSELLLVPMAFEGTFGQNDLAPDLDGSGTDRHEELPTVLTSVDGNSRLASAYRHMRLDPAAVVQRIGNNRALRQTIGNVLAFEDRDEITEDQATALRSLTAPAAIVIGFRPDRDDVDLAQAVQSRLGAIHVAPARAWSPASQYDLLLNATLDALADEFEDIAAAAKSFTAAQYASWLAGSLSAAEAREVGLDPEPDLRAAALRWWLRRRRTRISRAVRRLDVVRTVSSGVRAEIAAEGAMRSFRSELKTETEANNARRVLAALWQVQDLNTGDWEVDDIGGLGSIRTLTTKANAELAAAGRPGESGRLLMVVAFYWLARLRLVPLQTRGLQKDRRSIGSVITLMCRTEHGMRQLAQIVIDARAARTPRRVGPDGELLLSVKGKALPFTDEWVRETWTTTPLPNKPISAEKDLENREAKLLENIEAVGNALVNLREPEAGDGTPLVDSAGIQIDSADRALAMLQAVTETITEYRFLARRFKRSGASDPELDPESDDVE